MEKENKIKKHFYTNGEKTIKLADGDPIPDGYWKGRTFNQNSWNRGLTKDDPRMKNIMNNLKPFKKGQEPWNKGQTKETNSSLQIVSEKVSNAKKGKPGPNKNKPMSEEAKAKSSKTKKERYANGETIIWNKGLTKETNESIKSTSEKLKGHPCWTKDWKEAKRKEYETKKRNHTMNSSKVEEDYYISLCNEYGLENVYRQYVSDKYPFPCDFYIKSIDLYIEINFAPEHYFHPYDENNEEDLSVVEKWNSKFKETGSKRYLNMIYIFTERDPLKLKTFRENNLNFKIIYKNNLIIEK